MLITSMYSLLSNFRDIYIYLNLFILLIANYFFVAAHEVFGIPNVGIQIESVAIHPRRRKGPDVVIKSLRIIVSDVVMAIHGTEYVRSKTALF